MNKLNKLLNNRKKYFLPCLDMSQGGVECKCFFNEDGNIKISKSGMVILTKEQMKKIIKFYQEWINE